jgi:hypothetical protein
MSRPRLFKYLPIAFSAVCGIACVLICVLWARSYWYGEGFNWNFSTPKYMHISSDAGQLFLGMGSVPWIPPTYFRDEAGRYVDEHERIRMP